MLNFKKIVISIISLFFILFQNSCKKSINFSGITIGSSGKIESLDPARATTLKSLQLINALGDTLYEVDEKGKLIPKLASSIPVLSKDKLRLQIKLRENILFHDGTLFNSSAMKFTLERFLKIGTNNYIFENKIKSIEDPKPDILIINLNQPSSSIANLLTSINLTALSPDYYKNHFDKYMNDKFIGTGKYKLKRFSNNIQILSPNINYWGEKPRNKGINFVGYSNSSTLYGALISRQIDVLLSNSIEDTLRSKLKEISQNNKINEGISQSTEISFISLRTNKEPLNNQEIRLAIAKSLNRELISQKVSYGLRYPSKSIIPKFYKENNLNKWPKYEPKEAKKILRKYGYCKDKVLELPLTYRSNVTTDKLIALFWQQDVKRIMGECLSIEINGIESTTVYRNLKEGIYTAVILDWTGSYSDPAAYLLPLLSCNKFKSTVCIEGESVYSGSFWASEKIEDLFLESEKLIGIDRLNKLYQIEKIASESVPYIPIWISSQKAWSQKNISKPIFNSAGRILMGNLEIIND